MLSLMIQVLTNRRLARLLRWSFALTVALSRTWMCLWIYFQHSDQAAHLAASSGAKAVALREVAILHRIEAEVHLLMAMARRTGLCWLPVQVEGPACQTAAV